MLQVQIISKLNYYTLQQSFVEALINSCDADFHKQIASFKPFWVFKMSLFQKVCNVKKIAQVN